VCPAQVKNRIEKLKTSSRYGAFTPPAESRRQVRAEAGQRSASSFAEPDVI
jgi:hypothetical protein